MMQVVPLQAVPSQIVSCQLATQSTLIAVYQKSTGMFMNVYVDGVLIIGGVICENLNRIVRSLYLGFTGDFTFVDTQGAEDPSYTGIGTRFFLVYIEASELE